MSIVMGFDDVCRLLPQSYPFIMVDVVEELQPGKRIVCRKNVTGNEWMFPGHFPQRAIFPGVLLIEGMAQTAILLVASGRFAGGIRECNVHASQCEGPISETSSARRSASLCV